MSDNSVTVEVEDSETAQYIGHVLVEKARYLHGFNHGDERVVLELETIGRNLIEESREVGEDNTEEVFDGSLFDVK